MILADVWSLENFLEKFGEEYVHFEKVDAYFVTYKNEELGIWCGNRIDNRDILYSRETVNEIFNCGDGSEDTFKFGVFDDLKTQKVMQMVLVKGGTFMMGANPEQGDDYFKDDKPIHEVTLSDFYIGKFLVTQKEWEEIMGDNPSHFKGDDLPVENVSWNDVQDFITKLNQKTGKTYQLPTEAEWEYAARGGLSNKRHKYAGHNNIDCVAWYGDTSEGTTQPIGLKRANELGIYDMSGNVWEWCEDDWHDNYSGAPSTNQAWIDTPRAAYRVIRGGSWLNNAQFCSVSVRSNFTPSHRDNALGFRLAMSV